MPGRRTVLQWAFLHPYRLGAGSPIQAHGADLSLDELSASSHFRGNHPSFDELHGEAEAPAVGLVQKHVDAGFGMIFKSREDAEEYLEGACFPAPLGNVSTLKEDGTAKHRLIQYLKANQVNRASRDLAFCAAMAKRGHGGCDVDH